MPPDSGLTAGPLTGFTAPKTARIEIHSIEGVTLTDKQFLAGAKDGVPARIGGELRLPAGTGRVPAMILVHGSGGIGANVDRWAQELNGIGAATFLLDCFTGRGITQTITDQSQLGGLAMILDAYRALELLAKHPRIDAPRIGLMGFSKGGFAALYASVRRFQRMHLTGAEFAAYVAFYPPCNTTYLEDEEVSDRPIRVFHGTADDYVSIEPCRKYVERLRRAGKDVHLIECAGAGHVFDNPLFSPACFLPDAVTGGNCSWQERSGGQIVDAKTGQPFNWSNPCMRRGATVAHNAVATAEATKAVAKFLAEALRLHCDKINV
jgi:dienelactone hydrolase